MEDNPIGNLKENCRFKKAFAVILAFLEMGLLIIYVKILFAFEMTFSDNIIIRFVGLIICFIVLPISILIFNLKRF